MKKINPVYELIKEVKEVNEKETLDLLNTSKWIVFKAFKLNDEILFCIGRTID